MSEIDNITTEESSSVIVNPTSSKSLKMIDLHGDWTMSELNSDVVHEANIPGDNFSSLIRAGVIQDPYFGKRELDVQWVGERTWVWSRSFEVSPEFMDSERVMLRVDEIDTFSKIFINDREIGSTESQFVRYDFDIKSALKAGLNTISVVITPATDVAKRLADAFPFEVPSTFNHTVPHLNHVRKTHCHGGWDWGITLMVSGIYGPFQLEAFNEGKLTRVNTVQKHNADGCHLEVNVELEQVDIGGMDIEVHFDGTTRALHAFAGQTSLKTTIHIENPKLWWPAGYGEQPLYELSVTAKEQVIQKKIGLREVSWLNQPDEVGVSMTLQVNGVRIFCKGANWIPMDALPERYSRERYQQLLNDAKSANMNMVRLWGGGHYERDDFYEICDELGLLIWHDLMFACSLYPSDKPFLKQVREEVVYQTKRLRDHASIVIWCGDNEVVGAISWYDESKNNRDRYVASYQKLSTVIEQAIEEGDPSRVFWPSSPCSGSNPFESEGWHDDSKGDMHYWDVWHSGKDFEAYFDVTPRFCSEFGYQSFPSFQTVKSFADEEDYNCTSPVMEHHQKNDAGNQKILEMFTRYFRMPNGFKNFLYLSQVQQAVAIKTAVEHWRHLQPICMGTVYWQLNDNWPVSSWSSIEYNGHWKQLHYHAKRFFQPAIITAHQSEGQMNKNKVELWVVSECAKVAQVNVKARVMDFDGEVLLEKLLVSNHQPYESQKIMMDIDGLADFCHGCFLQLDLELDDGETIHRHSNTHFFERYKNCSLQAPNIQWRSERNGDEVEVFLSCDKPAFFTTLHMNDIAGTWSDNSITLLPDVEHRLKFTPKTPIDVKVNLNSAIEIQQLHGSYA